MLSDLKEEYSNRDFALIKDNKRTFIGLTCDSILAAFYIYSTKTIHLVNLKRQPIPRYPIDIEKNGSQLTTHCFSEPDDILDELFQVLQ